MYNLTNFFPEFLALSRADIAIFKRLIGPFECSRKRIHILIVMRGYQGIADNSFVLF